MSIRYFKYFAILRPPKIGGIRTKRKHTCITSFVYNLCARCEDVEGDVDCLRCGKKRHSFWDDPVGDLLTYLCEHRPWSTKIVVIALTKSQSVSTLF